MNRWEILGNRCKARKVGIKNQDLLAAGGIQGSCNHTLPEILQGNRAHI